MVGRDRKLFGGLVVVGLVDHCLNCGCNFNARDVAAAAGSLADFPHTLWKNVSGNSPFVSFAITGGPFSSLLHCWFPVCWPGTISIRQNPGWELATCK